MEWKVGDDFIAILKYRTTAEGGHKYPTTSGYRPQVVFPFTKMQTSGRQNFIDKEIVYPGDTVTAYIKIASPHLFQGSLTEGIEYEFREGGTVIGTGKIITILNQDLKKSEG